MLNVNLRPVFLLKHNKNTSGKTVPNCSLIKALQVEQKMQNISGFPDQPVTAQSVVAAQESRPESTLGKGSQLMLLFLQR